MRDRKKNKTNTNASLPYRRTRKPKESSPAPFASPSAATLLSITAAKDLVDFSKLVEVCYPLRVPKSMTEEMYVDGSFSLFLSSALSLILFRHDTAPYSFLNLTSFPTAFASPAPLPTTLRLTESPCPTCVMGSHSAMRLASSGSLSSPMKVQLSSSPAVSLSVAEVRCLMRDLAYSRSRYKASIAVATPVSWFER